MKITIQSIEDRKAVASILVMNGYIVKLVKKTKTENVGLEIWKEGEKKDERDN